MAYNLSDQQRAEVEKVVKYLKQMEGIIRTSPSEEQKARVQKELAKQRARLTQMVPGLDATKMNADQIIQELGVSAPAAAPARRAAASGAGGGGHRVLDKFPVGKASPHSTDPDVNFLATVFRTIQDEYWPAIAEQHCRLDFSRASERDALRTQLENVIRNMKVLLETIEEYSGAEKQDFREQLLKMKNRQTRAFIFDSSEMLKKVRDFLRLLTDDLESNGGIVTNKNDPIKFNSRYEEATVLEGRPVSEGIREFAQFVDEAIEELNMPTLKADRSPLRPG